MGNYYLLRDGLITDTSTYGMSISGAEKINNATEYTLSTSDSWSTLLSGSSADVVDSIAVHLSSRAAIPVGTLTLSVSSRTVSPTIVGTYPVSSFTSYDGSNNTVAVYPLNWQLLKLSSPFTNSTGTFKINLKTSNADQLTLMGTSTVNGVDYDRMAVLSSDFGYNNTISKTNVSLSAISPFAAETNSIYFTGTSELSTTDAIDCGFGTKPFTIEGWWYISSTTAAGSNGLISYMDGVAAVNGWVVQYDKASGTVYFGRLIGGNGVYMTGTAIVANQWNHIAISSEGSGGTVRCFVNGVLGATRAVFTDLTTTSTYKLTLGAWNFSTARRRMTGNIACVRVINGKCLYTQAFTPSSTPLNVYFPDKSSRTVFLYKAPYDNKYIYNVTVDNLHIGGTIDGYSTQSVTITANTTSIENLYVHKNGLLKFSNTSTTLTAVGLNGLQATSEGTIQVGSSASPVASDTTHQIILSGNHIGVSTGGRLDVYGAYKVPYVKFNQDYNSGLNTFTTVETVSTSWKVNDSLVFLPNTTSNNTTETFTVNSFSNANNFVVNTTTAHSHPVLSYVPNVANLTRNVKIGGASYTKKGNILARGGAFVNVNNAEFKYIDGSLSTGVDINGVFSVSGCTLSGNGTETLLTSIDTEFATIFNGTNSFIQGPANNTDFDVNVGTPFTLECFIKANTTTPSFNPFFSVRPVSVTNSDQGAFRLALRTSSVDFYFGASTITSPLNIIKINKWYHIAVVGNGVNVRMYVDGKLQGTKPQSSWSFKSTYVSVIGRYVNIIAATNYFNGKISNLRFVKGQAMYTDNFTPPTGVLPEITGSGIATAILTLQDGNNTPVDNSYRNATLTLNNITTELDSPFGKNSLNVNINNNVLFKTQYGIYLYNVTSDNNTINNNLILSSKDTGIYINDGLKGNITFDNNISVGPSPYGSYIENNTTGTKLNGIVNYNNTYGMAVSSSHAGQIDNVINTYNTRDGIIVDGTISQLNETTFSNITASNNRTLGVRLTGNPIDHLAPVILNINRLVANDNLSGGFEGYCIAGNLSSVELNRNGFYGMKTSIGNYNTTFDGITALMNNVATTSAAIGILSGICYYPILIKDANVGKSVSSSTFGAGISLDSTKFSEFSVDSSTVSGGSSDFQLRTTSNILEGSYLISNTNVGVLPVGVGISTSNYQSDVLKTTGFAFTNMNNITGYHVTYLAAGNRSIDSTTTCNINETTSPSERLTPQSNSLKLRSGSKFVALNAGESTAIAVYVRKSTLATNGVDYNGTAPRLILKRNGAVGINSDILMDQLDTTSENFLKLAGVSPAVTDAGVIEFYVDCDGTQGWINIDNWTAN